MPADGRRATSISGWRHRRIGVIDVGSNSIRLVVYDCSGPVPYPMFNEKVLCGLGRDMADSHCLNPKGVRLAIANLRRFNALCQAMGVRRVKGLATAAIRDAKDGAAFVRTVRKDIGIKLSVLSGGEEATLSAAGVLASLPDADGVMGDMGGGSLELVALRQGKHTQHCTLPVGSLRLLNIGDQKKSALAVRKHLGTVSWLSRFKGRDLYLVGGSWRAIGRLHIAQSGYPLNVIHGYTLKPEILLEFAGLVAKMSPDSLAKNSPVPKGRRETLPDVAQALLEVLECLAPKRIIFSGYGLREGYVFKNFARDLKKLDPLTAVCADIGGRLGRFDIAKALFDWMTPIFPKESEKETRLRLAACHISDIAWMEHANYRAEHAFYRILRTPFIGADHATHMFLALAVHHRYGGRTNDPLIKPLRKFLGEADAQRAAAIGRALHLAYTLSGGTEALILQTRLCLDGGQLGLEVPTNAPVFSGTAAENRLRSLATAIGRTTRPLGKNLEAD